MSSVTLSIFSARVLSEKSQPHLGCLKGGDSHPLQGQGTPRGEVGGVGWE